MSSETPKRSSHRSSHPPKRSIQLRVGDESSASIKRRKEEDEFVDSAIKAVCDDEGLSNLLNLVVFQRESDSEKRLVVVTTKMMCYYEPVKHMSRLRLVLSCDGSYYIQVMLM